MAPPLLSWLLRWAFLCHLTLLLAGEHHGVKKCNIICNKLTSKKIPMSLLISYRRNQPSCGTPVIILTTVKHRNFCADPKEEWVREAMGHLDRRAAAPVQSGGTFEKQIAMEEPGTHAAARGVDRPAVTEPTVAGESSPQETQRSLDLGASPQLPTAVAGSMWSRSLTTPQAGAGPETSELYNPAAIITTTSRQSSATYSPGPSTPALPTQTPSTPALPTQTPSTQTPSTPAPSTPALPTQTPSSPALPIQIPSSPAPSSPALSISHTATEDYTEPEGQTVRLQGQTPTPGNSLGPEEMGLMSAHTEAFVGPRGMPHVSVVPVSSKGAPSRESVTSDSQVSKAEESTHAIVHPQRQAVPDSQAATRRQAIGLLAFLGLLFCLGVAMFAYQSLQACHVSGNMVEGLRYVPRSCGSNSYVLVPV